MKLKKVLKYLTLFFVPILILNLSIIIRTGLQGLENQYIIGDLNTQYVSLIKWFQDVLLGRESLLYSFGKGAGGNMFSTFAYYLSSPINLILVFLKGVSITKTIMLLINIKIGLCSVFMYIFLKNKFQSDDFIKKFTFSLIYALCGTVICYYYNLMWLDAFYLIPIVMLGIEKLVHENKILLYTIFLSITVIANFYMGYIVCICCLIYFIYLMCLKYTKENKEEIKKTIKIFIIASLISVLISCIVLIPTIADMTNMFRYAINKSIFYLDLKTIPMVVSKMIIGGMDIVIMFSHNEANLYITLFGLLLVIMFFLNKNINKKEKKITAIIIMFFMLSIIFNGLNLVWHGLSFPNGYNYRYSIFICFFLILIAYKSYDNLSITKNVKSYLFMFLIIFGVGIFILSRFYAYLNLVKICINIAFLLAYVFLFAKVIKNKNIVLFALIIAELFVNCYYCFITKNIVNDYYYQYAGFTSVLDVERFRKELDGHFLHEDFSYRSDVSQIVSYNDSLLFNYRGLGTALSTNNAKYYRFLANSGYIVTYSTIVNDYDNGPFMDSIMGLKNIFLLEEDEEMFYDYVSSKEVKVGKDEITYLKYDNSHALKLGYVVAENKNIEFKRDAFLFQNDLAKSMSGLDINLFDETILDKTYYQDGKQESIRFLTEDKHYYLYNSVPVPINNTTFGKVYVESSEPSLMHAGRHGIYKLLNVKGGGTVNISYVAEDEYLDYVDLKIYSLNEENFNTIINKLKQNQLEVTNINKNILTGKIKIDNDDSLLMLTLPYEKGWNIYVDGKKVDYEEVYNTFIGIRLDSGEHEIKMKFYSPGLILGFIFSISGIVSLILWNKFRKCEK